MYWWLHKKMHRYLYHTIKEVFSSLEWLLTTDVVIELTLSISNDSLKTVYVHCDKENMFDSFDDSYTTHIENNDNVAGDR